MDTNYSESRKKLWRNHKVVSVTSPTVSEVEKLYPTINHDFDYGLIIAISEYMKEIKAVFVYPLNGRVFAYAEDGSKYSLGEILLYSENIYYDRLHN